MLVSTRILYQYSSKTTVVRDWRVVSIPEEDSRSNDVATLFFRLCMTPSSADKAGIRVEVGSSQAASFQGVPLTVSIAEFKILYSS